MEPLITLVLVTGALWALGALGVRPLRPWPTALRGGLAAMFVLTGVAHFVGKRAELIAMVPPFLPAPALLVTVTGVLELAGAAGLLWSRTAPWAAAGLSVLLVAMFPANVHKALTVVPLGFDDQLVPRTALQLVFLAATLAVVGRHVHELRRHRATEPSGERGAMIPGATARPTG
ncbi:DoxX family protein [Actinomycetospora cinnamomea]|uniref:Putative membrane protein n=1 Tax=Actinomycetospora cinnamomea TaxID=663609 RepID=A0A2U1EB31_9PSEU|nr:DoxX family membrane protein [Actinomycetospora cinnamomea]PVY97095.1 putative membrane protein [Actinomycetospora cinnamomea]